MSYRRATAVVIGLALLVGITAVIQGTSSIIAPPGDSDLLSFFFPAAARVLDGQPLAIYAVRAFGDYPNNNPPISIEWMAALIGLAKAVGLPGAAACVSSGFSVLDCRALVSFVGFGFLPFVFALGALVVAAVRRLAPDVTPVGALLSLGLVVLGPLLWLDFTQWWHLEQPLMLCFLVAGVLALQAQRLWLAALLLGLAILTRTTAMVPVIALLAVLLAERKWRPMVIVGAGAAVVAAIGLAPFILADPANAIFSLVSWRSSAAIGNSIWSLVAGTPVASIAQRIDQPVAIVLALAAGWFAVRRLGVRSDMPGLWGVLAVAAMLVPMLSKLNWPYYAVEPFILLLVFEVSVAGRPVSAVSGSAGASAGDAWWRGPIPLITVLFLAAALTLGQFMGNHSVTNGGIVLRLMGVTQFVVMGAFAWAAWRLMAATARDRETTSRASA
jgi:hypothetical protein